jgi:hypothetical protein
MAGFLAFDSGFSSLTPDREISSSVRLQIINSHSLHMDLQSYFHYAIDCTEPRVFNWCDGLLHSIKSQLTKSKNGELKQFGYGSILASFFLERFPHLRLQVYWNILVPRDPRMKQWCDLMSWHVASPIIKYNDIFFDWLET